MKGMKGSVGIGMVMTLPLTILFLVIQLGRTDGKVATLVHVNDDNWDQIMEGEWMVEFFAPWCPACRSLQPVWEEFSGWAKDLHIQVGQVDITSSPGLSGRFMITALPTIFHVKEGLFRQYKGARTKEEFLNFVEEKKWQALDPVSSWQSPSSVQMTVISQFYKISMGLRTVMNVMLEEYGIPAWAAYLLFGVATIIIGLILGLLLVCIIDCIYPPAPHKPMAPVSQPLSEDDDQRAEEKDSDDDFTEELQDESQGEEEVEEAPKEQEGSGDGGEETTTGPTRRRKVRKAD